MYIIIHKLFRSGHSGVPVAWAIMDKKDTASHKTFFSAIEDRVPTAQVTCVMTDDGKTPVACLQLL